MSERDPSDGVALVAFGRTGMVEHAGTAPPNYPALPKSAEPDQAAFHAADELEFQKKDLAGAVHALQTIAGRKEPVVRAIVILRIATLQKRHRNVSGALDAFAELGRLGELIGEERPAELAARQGRALILENTGQRVELQREAAAICSDLENGRWMLSYGIFKQSYDQARQWLAVERPPIDPDRLALAEAADSAWREWETSRDRTADERSLRTLQVGDVSVLLLTRSTFDRYNVLLMAPRFLETAWLTGLRSADRSRDLGFALTDTDGRPVLGQADAPPAMKSVRPASTTQLPWNVHVISKASAAADLSGQTKLVLAGIVMMGMLALAGGYLINRAIFRELRVARLQSDFVAAVSHEFRTPLTLNSGSLR